MHLLNCGAGEACWESLGSKEITPVNPEGNKLWIFIERTDAETEAPILWPSDVKSRLTAKDPDIVKDWGQLKEATEGDMIGWHHTLNGHAFEQTLRDSRAAVHGVAKSQTWLSDWTTTCKQVLFRQIASKPHRTLHLPRWTTPPHLAPPLPLRMQTAQLGIPLLSWPPAGMSSSPFLYSASWLWL